jgi:hypothetical protein
VFEHLREEQEHVDEAMRRFEVWKGTFDYTIFGGHSALLTLRRGIRTNRTRVVDHVDVVLHLNPATLLSRPQINNYCGRIANSFGGGARLRSLLSQPAYVQLSPRQDDQHFEYPVHSVYK